MTELDVQELLDGHCYTVRVNLSSVPFEGTVTEREAALEELQAAIVELQTAARDHGLPARVSGLEDYFRSLTQMVDALRVSVMSSRRREELVETSRGLFIAYQDVYRSAAGLPSECKLGQTRAEVDLDRFTSEADHLCHAFNTGPARLWKTLRQTNKRDVFLSAGQIITTHLVNLEASLRDLQADSDFSTDEDEVASFLDDVRQIHVDLQNVIAHLLAGRVAAAVRAERQMVRAARDATRIGSSIGITQCSF